MHPHKVTVTGHVTGQPGPHTPSCHVPVGVVTPGKSRRGMATHREGMHIGPIGGWVSVFLRQTYSSSMTPANNCPPSMYVWKGGNSFLGGRAGAQRVVRPFPGPPARQGDPCPVRVKSATKHGHALSPNTALGFPPPPGGEEIYVVRHGATSAGTFLRHWTVDSLGPKLWVGPTTVPVFPRQSTPTRPPHITNGGVFGASCGPLTLAIIPCTLSPITNNRLGAEHVIRLPLAYH